MSEEVRMLVNRCLEGEQPATVQLIQRFRSQVFGLCYRMLGHYQDAEDATQETFTRVLRHLSRWDQNRAFEPWLLTIAGNRCRTALARRLKRPVAQPLVETVQDDTPDQQRLNNLVEEINIALAGLRPEYRHAFELFHNDGCSYVEMSERLNCPVGTVKTWVHRARRELIDYLKKRQVIED